MLRGGADVHARNTLLYWERENKPRATERIALANLERSSVSLGDSGSDRQPEPCPSDLMIATSAGDKGLEDAPEDVLGDARAVILDGDLDVLLRDPGCGDKNPRALFWRMLVHGEDRVVDEDEAHVVDDVEAAFACAARLMAKPSKYSSSSASS